MAPLNPIVDGEGRTGVVLRCESGFEMNDKPWLSFRRNLLVLLLVSPWRACCWANGFSLRPTMVHCCAASQCERISSNLRGSG